MQAAKRLAGVAPEVNLRIPLHTDDEVRGPTLALKPMSDIMRCPKQGYQWPHKKGLMSSKFFLKK